MDVTKDVTILFDLVKNVALFNPFLQFVYLTRKHTSVYQSHLSGARINSSPTRGIPIMKANSKMLKFFKIPYNSQDTEKASQYGQMEINLKVNSKMEKDMARV